MVRHQGKTSADRRQRRLRMAASEFDDGVAQVLAPALGGLAAAVLASGGTSLEFTRLARQAFIDEAVDLSLASSGKINQSRIAAMTGLSRAGIRRLLTDALTVANQRKFVYQSIARRILAVWRVDPYFADPAGTPRVLPLRGSKSSFSVLVKKHAQGFSEKTILEELRRTGSVWLRNSRVGISKQASTPSPVLQRLEKIAPIIWVLCRDAVGGVDTCGNSRIDLVYLPARDDVETTLLSRRATEVVSAATGALRSLTVGAPRERSVGGVLVGAIVAESRAGRRGRRFLRGGLGQARAVNYSDAVQTASDRLRRR